MLVGVMLADVIVLAGLLHDVHYARADVVQYTVQYTVQHIQFSVYSMQCTVL